MKTFVLIAMWFFQQNSTLCHMEIYAAVYTVSDDEEVGR